MEREVKIKTSKRIFFQQYLRVIKSILKPYLSNGELKVLGELLYYNNEYKHLEKKIRKKIILDYDTKNEIIENLKISQNTLANALTVLRKSGYLVNGELREDVQVDLGGTYNLTYKFTIND